MNPFNIQKGIPMRITQTVIMKKFIIAVATILTIALMQSCGNNHKQCGAYSQHESGAQPTYDQVQ